MANSMIGVVKDRSVRGRYPRIALTRLTFHVLFCSRSRLMGLLRGAQAAPTHIMGREEGIRTPVSLPSMEPPYSLAARPLCSSLQSVFSLSLNHWTEHCPSKPSFFLTNLLLLTRQVLDHYAPWEPQALESRLAPGRPQGTVRCASKSRGRPIFTSSRASA